MFLNIENTLDWLERKCQNWLGVYRVCTDFWIQNSRLFPHLFPKQEFLKVLKWVINIALKKCRTKLFSWCTANVQGQDWIRFDQNNKKFTYKARKYCCSFEKTLYYPDFFKNSRLCTIPVLREIVFRTSLTYANIAGNASATCTK